MSSFNSTVSANSTTYTLSLGGYNFAIDKMHFIASKYPLKSEMYLRNTHVPDVHEYLAWKDVSTLALVNKLTAKQALYAFEEKIRAGGVYATQIDGVVSPTRSEASTVIAADPQELEAARILGAMQFKAMNSHGTIHADHSPHQPPPQPNPAILMSSPTFPRPDKLPMPSGEDAFLLNPTLEDAQRRWVKGVHKQDLVKEVSRVDEEGKRTRVQKTYYVVDGEEFLDVESPRKMKAMQQRTRRQVNTAATKTSMTSVAPFSQTQLRKRPLDSAIALDEDFDALSRKRQRSVFSDDEPLSSMSRPGGGFPGRIPSPSGYLECGAADGVDLPPIPSADSRMFTMRGFVFKGQAMLPAPTTMSSPMHHPTHIVATPPSGTNRSSRRRGPPAPLNLSAPAHSKRARADHSRSPSPVKTSRKPQHSNTTRGKTAQRAAHPSSPAAAPRRNKYVPTTPNPQRWSCDELYHLNALARQGLHPKELHPLMLQKFPDKIRSVHAIKDRRDKMSRAKELTGNVPDYRARYGEV
jgi:hypothetical protein